VDTWRRGIIVLFVAFGVSSAAEHSRRFSPLDHFGSAFCNNWSVMLVCMQAVYVKCPPCPQTAPTRRGASTGSRMKRHRVEHACVPENIDVSITRGTSLTDPFKERMAQADVCIQPHASLLCQLEAVAPAAFVLYLRFLLIAARL